MLSLAGREPTLRLAATRLLTVGWLVVLLCAAGALPWRRRRSDAAWLAPPPPLAAGQDARRSAPSTWCRAGTPSSTAGACWTWSIVFLLAAVLGAVIAYHPRTRAKASTLAELEQPKTFIMYALVGAVTAKIVEANSAMAFVVFGIGGLMRFRTDVGPAKDTGRVILTAVVGVCCGLKLLVVAVGATAFGWVLLWLLEKETFTRLLVKGLPHDIVAPRPRPTGASRPDGHAASWASARRCSRGR